MRIFENFIKQIKLNNYKKLAVVGSQNHSDKSRIKEFLEYILSNSEIDTIICGNAPGVDQITQQIADEFDLQLITIEPKNGEYKNFTNIQDIIEEADCILAFNDHGSPGTKYAAEKAKELNKYLFEHEILF